MAQWLGNMMMLLALVACSEESDEPQGNILRLSSVTRADSRLSPDANSSIKLYVMTNDAKYSEGTFHGISWTNTNILVKEHEQFYLYGFMPGSYSSSISAASSDLNGDYSKGADLTITELPMFPTEDLCVVVGVRKVSASSENTEATEGNYSYLSGLNNENYVNLLMDHLYSQLILQFNVDPDYHALRHIKLKTVSLTSTYGDKVDARVKFRAGSSLGANTVAYSKATGAANTISKEVLAAGTQFITTTATDTKFGPFNCAPCTFDAEGTNLSLTCTYDVYNTAETKVLRADCTATNKLKVTSMDHGVRKTVTLTVTPTYLYTLSDDDLNNPTIVVN